MGVTPSTAFKASVTCMALLAAAHAASAQPALQAQYATYAAGLHVAEVTAGFSLSRDAYRLNLSYHTTGMVSLFYSGHQESSVVGAWSGGSARPMRFLGEGLWRGRQRITDIGYDDGHPVVRQMVPLNDEEREPVPEALQIGSIDTLSALMDLIRVVAATGRCEVSVRTYDGRRATEIAARTAGVEDLTPLRDSPFGGTALRCDFQGRMLAGFLFSDNREREGRPLHGSAWIAKVVPNAPPVPVRMSFETRWFGDATMYLTSVKPVPGLAMTGRTEEPTPQPR